MRHLLLIGLALILVAGLGVGLVITFRGGAPDDAAADQHHSAITAPIDKAKDLTVEANTRMISTGVEAYIAENGAAPDPAQVSAGGAVGQLAGQWPENPFTRQPVKNAASPGDYTYQVVSGGAGYQLVGYGADGQPVVSLP